MTSTKKKQKPAAAVGKGKVPKVNVAELVDQLRRSIRLAAVELSLPPQPVMDYISQLLVDPLVPYPPTTLMLPTSAADARVMRVIMSSLVSKQTAAVMSAYKLHRGTRAICAWTLPITLPTLQTLTSCIRLCARITTLELVNNGLTSASVAGIRDALVHRATNTITTLKLDCNPIGSDGLSHIADALRFNSTLTALSVSTCAIQTDGAIHIERILTIEHGTLKSLNVSGNHLHTIGLRHIAVALLSPPNIIYHDNDDISTLRSLSSLTSLDYSHNRITPMDIISSNNNNNSSIINTFLKSLQYSTHLTRINLDGNSLGFEALNDIADALPLCRHITQFVLSPFADCDAYRSIVQCIQLHQPKKSKSRGKGKRKGKSKNKQKK